jgi:hypothetical protein
MIEVTSLEECIFHAERFDKIIVDISYGTEYLFFNYNPLGLGNLLTGFLGATAVSDRTSKKHIIPVFKTRIHALSRDILSWIARSSFAVSNFQIILDRAKYSNSAFGKDISYIDTAKRVLHLSTHLVNVDPSYLLTIKNSLRGSHDQELYSAFGISITRKNSDTIWDNKSLSIGLHIRRGDFKVKPVKIDNFEHNFSPDIVFFTDIIRRFKIGSIKTVTIYSDQSDLDTRKMLLDYFPKDFDYRIFGSIKKSSVVLNDMMKNDLLVHCNSTLSNWSSILSGQIAIYPWDRTPLFANRIFDNFFDVEELNQVLKRLNME